MGCALSVAAGVGQKDADLLAQYELTKKIGMGMEGEVWLAKSRETGESAAIKLVRRGYDDFLGPRIKREIQLQAKLSHVNIAELRQVLLTPKHLCLVMDYQEGGDLHGFCTHKRIDEEVARYLFRQIIAALEYCHNHRIAHRDLKLANFLLDTNRPPRVKLTDFGCAREWVKSSGKAGAPKMDKFATFLGTPAYMAPQVLESAFYPTKRYSATGADVWSCGILLCHIFFGAHTPYWMEPNAFQDDNATQLARLEAMRKLPWSESDKWIQEHAHELSEDLRDLLSRIFIADESQRITIQGIKEHRWVTAPLNAKLEAALQEMEDEQEVREHLGRTAVSRAAQHADAADGQGCFATLELLADLGYKMGKMPGTDQRLVVVDMAHMDTLDTSSTATTALLDTISWASPSPVPTPDASFHNALSLTASNAAAAMDSSAHAVQSPAAERPLALSSPVLKLPALPSPALASRGLASAPALAAALPTGALRMQSPFASPLAGTPYPQEATDAAPSAAAAACTSSDQAAHMNRASSAHQAGPSVYRSNTGGLPPQWRQVLSLEKRGKGSMVVARYGVVAEGGTYSSVHGGASYYDQRMASSGIATGGGSLHGEAAYRAVRLGGSAHAGTMGLRQGGSAHSSGGVAQSSKDSGAACNGAGASLYGGGGSAAPAGLAAMQEVHGA